jgi:hypothetical protein
MRHLLRLVRTTMPEGGLRNCGVGPRVGMGETTVRQPQGDGIGTVCNRSSSAMIRRPVALVIQVRGDDAQKAIRRTSGRINGRGIMRVMQPLVWRGHFTPVQILQVPGAEFLGRKGLIDYMCMRGALFWPVGSICCEKLSPSIDLLVRVTNP